MNDTFERFFGIHSCEAQDDGDVLLTWRGVSRGGHKEFFSARLSADDGPEENMARMARALRERAEHEESEWEERLT